MRDTEPAGLLILSGLLSVGGNVVRNSPRPLAQREGFIPQGRDIDALPTGRTDQIPSVTGSCREKSWSCLGSQTILDTRFHFCVISSTKFLSEGFREKVRNGIPDWMT